ncbi:hypothetical protein EVAR_90306_1 [Eumeta japonica]|uniref:Uncharacterized protein n=1 Tax=Eumeta variegata TaxID=151549 RepID=A0A4C1ZQH1_EUMVA|nr:hypothetical protein EVAR_90306_1 [Eumeta japonica]
MQTLRSTRVSALKLSTDPLPAISHVMQYVIGAAAAIARRHARRVRCVRAPPRPPPRASPARPTTYLIVYAARIVAVTGACPGAARDAGAGRDARWAAAAARERDRSVPRLAAFHSDGTARFWIHCFCHNSSSSRLSS